MTEGSIVTLAIALLPVAVAELRRWDRRRARRKGHLRTRAEDLARAQLLADRDRYAGGQVPERPPE